MDKFDRVFQLHTVLGTRRAAESMQILTERLECNKSTVHRVIAMMCDRLGAPIEFDKESCRSLTAFLLPVETGI